MTFPWYLHAAANIYQHRNKIARASTAYHTYKTARRTMGFLRGSNKMVPYRARPYSSSKPTTRLATELKHIHRKLNKQRPETKHWFHTWVPSAAALVTSRHDIDITGTFHGDPAFRDNVLGDKWRNLTLEIFVKSVTSGALGSLRLVVYKPKKTGTVWPGLATNAIIDPNDHTVLLDRRVPMYLECPDGTSTFGKFFMRYSCPLRNTITSYDTMIRKGDIKVALLFENDRALTTSFDVKFMLKYQNM